MRRFFLLLTSILLFIIAQSQPKFNGRNVNLISPSGKNLSRENDSIKFSFKPTLCNDNTPAREKNSSKRTSIIESKTKRQTIPPALASKFVHSVIG
jgi:hypothetical protein